MQMAARLFKPVSLKAKFKFVGVVICLTVSIPVLHLFAKEVIDMRQASHALDGLEATRPARYAMENLAWIQIANLRIAKGDASAADLLAKSQKEFDLTLSTLEFTAKDREEWGLAASWKTLKPQLQAARAAKVDTPEGALALRQAFAGLNAWFATVTDASGLSSSHTSLDTHYLMVSTQFALPQTIQAAVDAYLPPSAQAAQAKKAEAPADDGMGAFGDVGGLEAPAANPAPAPEEKPAEAPAAASAASSVAASSAAASPVEAAPAAPEAPVVAPSLAAQEVSLGRLQEAGKAVALQVDQLAVANPLFKERFKKLVREFNLAFGDYQDALQARASNSEKPAHDELAQLVEAAFALHDAQYKALDTLLSERHAGYLKGLLWELLFVSLMAAVLYRVFTHVTRGTRETIERLNAATRALAEGDLGVVVTVKTQDELASVAQNINHMAAELKELVALVKAGGETLHSSAAGLQGASREVAVSAVHQRDAAVGMAAAVEQLSANINEVTAHARRGNDISSQTNEISARSGEVIHRMSQEMSTISESVRSTATAIESLGEHSDRISSVVQVIQELADQTNLLALNAAIEAARAGEQGRGFAVVADEVRKLAERTTRQTQAIAEIIEAIQDSTMNTILSMGSVVAKVNEGVELANSAGEAIEEIRNQGASSLAIAQDIAAALLEQSSASESLSENVQQIAGEAQKNTESAELAAVATEQMLDVAENLKQAVDRFKV